jgi:DNA-3-methyladenine glycosylase I
MSYCGAVRAGNLSDVHRTYHDTQYGFPVQDDDLLFERLVLEINQAGLSWETILKKQESFRSAYGGFEIAVVAEFGPPDVKRLLTDAGIVRNRLKVEAAIENARRLLTLRREYGSFVAWLDAHHPRDREDWTRLFRKTFRFTGGEIVHEFLLSTGYLPGAHDEDCPVGRKVRRLRPPFLRSESPARRIRK